MPEKHATLNKQTELSLRIDRLDSERRQRLEAEAAWEQWRAEHHGE